MHGPHALVASQQRSDDDLYETAALKTMLPWLTAHVEQSKREMGGGTISGAMATSGMRPPTVLRYPFEQGLSRRYGRPAMIGRKICLPRPKCPPPLFHRRLPCMADRKPCGEVISLSFLSF